MTGISMKQTKTGLKLKKESKKPSNPKGWKERYDIHCPYCFYEMQCAPSIFHMMGMANGGHGECSECNESFLISFVEESNSMTTKKLEE